MLVVLGSGQSTSEDAWIASGKPVPEDMMFAGGSPFLAESTGEVRSDEVYSMLNGTQKVGTIACSCHSFDPQNGGNIASSECGFSCKDVDFGFECTLPSDMTWGGIRPTVEMHRGKTCDDLLTASSDEQGTPLGIDESPYPGPAAGGGALSEANEHGWPKNAEQNVEIVEEVHDLMPGVLEANGPVTGSFIIVLTPIIVAGANEPAYKANERRMKNIEKQLQEKQAEVQAKKGAKAFCGEVVHSMQFLNMMSCNLSPECTKWMAQLRDVELIEPDGIVTAQEPDIGVGSVSLASMGVSSFSSSLEPAVSTSSVGSNTGAMGPRRLLRGNSRD